VFKTIITAALCALILASTTAPGLAQKMSPLPAPTADMQQACTHQVIEDATKVSVEKQKVMVQRGSLAEARTVDAERRNQMYLLDKGDFAMQVHVAKCLASVGHYAESIAIMKPIVAAYGPSGRGLDERANYYLAHEAWHDYALVLEEKGDRIGASHAMMIAYKIAKSNYVENAKLEADYKRLAAVDIAIQRAQQRNGNAAEEAARIAKSRRFWDACSADQRRILVQKGGEHTNRDHNVGESWGPNRIQTYDAANYHQETWWYYGLRGRGSAEAFTFHNGRLVSHYQA
jgi:hypothetical protein